MHKFVIAAAIAVTVGLMVIAGVGSVLNVQAQTSACVSGGAVPSQYPDLVKDCETLLGMKGAIRGSGKLNWWTGRSIEKWDGVQLSGNRVTGIDLTGFGLNGIIPAELAQLPLKKLLLSGNSFTGCVPDVLLQIEHTDVGNIGLPLCSGGNATPSPTPSSVTPEPTPTPTPAEVACTQFSAAALEAWWGTVTYLPDDHFKYHDELRKKLAARLSHTVALRDTEPAMYRALVSTSLRFAAASIGSDGQFPRMLIGARQMERLCAVRGYDTPAVHGVSPDVLVEYACGRSWLAYNKPSSPGLGGGYGCQGHSHSSY